jgi:hypothetical protein
MRASCHPDTGSPAQAGSRVVTLVRSPLVLRQAQAWYPLRELDAPLAGGATVNHVLDRAYAAQEAALNLRAQRRHRSADDVERQTDELLRTAEDPNALPTFVLNESGEEYTTLPTPSRGDFAFWCFGTPSGFPDAVWRALLQPGQEAEIERARQHLVRFHRIDRERKRQTQNGYVDPDTTRQLRAARTAVTTLLDLGLQLRLDARLLGADLTTYNYIAASGVQSNQFRACEDCLHVFRGHRARRCRRAPNRVSPRPWHSDIRPGDRASGKRTTIATTNRDGSSTLAVTINHRAGSHKTLYHGNCNACGREYESTDARSRYCSTCASGAARTTRSRTQPADRPA